MYFRAITIVGVASSLLRSGLNLLTMKIKLTRPNLIKFFHEIIDEFGEASTYYGTKMDKPGEEEAAEAYEKAWLKMQQAMKLIFEGPARG